MWVYIFKEPAQYLPKRLGHKDGGRGNWDWLTTWRSCFCALLNLAMVLPALSSLDLSTISSFLSVSSCPHSMLSASTHPLCSSTHLLSLRPHSLPHRTSSSFPLPPSSPVIPPFSAHPLPSSLAVGSLSISRPTWWNREAQWLLEAIFFWSSLRLLKLRKIMRKEVGIWKRRVYLSFSVCGFHLHEFSYHRSDGHRLI